MKSLKRDLLHISAFSALALSSALAWGAPFIIGVSSGGQAQPQQPRQQPQPQQPDDQQNKSATFTGTIVKKGDAFVLHDSSGITYGLDDAERVSQFEGKVVKVTGQLDEQARVIHVQDIESAEG